MLQSNQRPSLLTCLWFVLVSLAGCSTEVKTPTNAKPTPDDDIEHIVDLSDGPLSRIAFGSCAKQDRPQPIWDALLAEDPHLFLFIGDNIYGDTENMEELLEEARAETR